MAQYMLLFLTLLAGCHQCLTQTPVAVPPNCVCPTRPSPVSTMNEAQQPVDLSQQAPLSPDMGMLREGRRGHRMHGEGKKMKIICANDGQNYTNKCDFVNAKFRDETFGMRPCFLSFMHNGDQQMRSTKHPEKQETVCLTTGQSLTSTKRELKQQLIADSMLGIRCEGACPCKPLKCPSEKKGKHDDDD